MQCIYGHPMESLFYLICSYIWTSNRITFLINMFIHVDIQWKRYSYLVCSYIWTSKGITFISTNIVCSYIWTSSGMTFLFSMFIHLDNLWNHFMSSMFFHLDRHLMSRFQFQMFFMSIYNLHDKKKILVTTFSKITPNPFL